MEKGELSERISISASTSDASTAASGKEREGGRERETV